jgi:hypothetical protein
MGGSDMDVPCAGRADAMTWQGLDEDVWRGALCPRGPDLYESAASRHFVAAQPAEVDAYSTARSYGFDLFA